MGTNANVTQTCKMGVDRYHIRHEEYSQEENVAHTFLDTKTCHKGGLGRFLLVIINITQ